VTQHAAVETPRQDDVFEIASAFVRHNWFAVERLVLDAVGFDLGAARTGGGLSVTAVGRWQRAILTLTSPAQASCSRRRAWP
jgi:hypothetical protein